MPDSFRTRLRRGDRLIGPVVTLSSPDVADLLSRIGFEPVADIEHSSMGISQAVLIRRGALSVHRGPENSGRTRGARYRLRRRRDSADSLGRSAHVASCSIRR